MGGEIDLFGNPLEPLRDRRGRPSYKISKENQDFVAVRAARGWSHERIAEDMGIDPKTLRKNFSRELVSGATMVEGMTLDVLMRQARTGHVASIRQLREMIETAPPRRAPRQPDAGHTVAAAAPGKKAQALLAAQDVPDDYGDIFARRRKGAAVN